MAKPVCGKIPHATRSAAIEAMIAARKSGRVEGSTNTYECKTCGWWHWGHAPGKNRISSKLTIKGWRN